MSTHSVEDIKTASDGLRGTLAASLADAITGALREDDQTLIKYHGSYQQDDRDVREARRRAKLEPAYSFMIRTRTPGGVLSPAQWLKLDELSQRFAERGLRITTRQALQFHGVIKAELKPTLRAINEALIDTLAACGDVNRNVTVSANPVHPRVHGAVHALAMAVSERLLPATRAYYQLWLDEERIGGAEPDDIYGKAYLPRKFKIGFAVPPFNDVDVYAQDLGFIAVIENGVLAGFDVVAGGGMGATHGDAETYPRLASPLGFVTAGDVLAVAVAVVRTQRDWGNRTQRKRARLKYTIDDRGLEAFREEVQRRSGVHFQASRAAAFEHNGDRFGWVDTGTGHANLTLRIPAGRVWDRDGLRYQAGLREIARRLTRIDGAHLRMTPNQNLVLAGIDTASRADIDALVASHGLDLHAQARATQLNTLACVALPTCGLAMAEAERYLPDFIRVFEACLASHGLAGENVHLRLSGCPNGCSRPYLAEVALVGKAPGRYNLFVGGDHRGQRLATLHRENVDEAAILESLDVLLARYAAERDTGERFGDFLQRAKLVRDARLPLELVA